MITYFSLTDLTDLTRSHARSTEISQDLLTWPDLTFNVWLTSDIWHLVLTLVTTDLLLWQHLTIFCLVPFATLAGQWQSPGGPGPAMRLPSKAFTFSSLPSSCPEGLIQGPSMTSQVPQPTCYRSKLGSLTNQWQDLRYGKKKNIYIYIDWLATSEAECWWHFQVWEGWEGGFPAKGSSTSRLFTSSLRLNCI